MMMVASRVNTAMQLLPLLLLLGKFHVVTSLDEVVDVGDNHATSLSSAPLSALVDENQETTSSNVNQDDMEGSQTVILNVGNHPWESMVAEPAPTKETIPSTRFFFATTDDKEAEENVVILDRLQELSDQFLAAMRQIPIFYDDEFGYDDDEDDYGEVLEEEPQVDEQTFDPSQDQQQHRLLNDNRFITPPPSPTLNVKKTCDAYNGLGYNCTCFRSLRHDVLAECEIGERICTNDTTVCFDQTFTVILDGTASMGSKTLPANRMTTCTTQWDTIHKVGVTPPNQTDIENMTDTVIEATDKLAEDAADALDDKEDGDEPIIVGDYSLTHKTCVEIQPNTPGLFNETIRCGASVNGHLCRSCTQCSASSRPVNLTEPGKTTITIDCCNAYKNAKQTCGVVHSESGITLPVFDPPGTHKGCNGSGALRTTATLLVSVLASSVVLSGVLF